jgi:hypothetical protein
LLLTLSVLWKLMIGCIWALFPEPTTRIVAIEARQTVQVQVRAHAEHINDDPAGRMFDNGISALVLGQQ